MMNNLHPIRDYIVPGKRAHLVGIGGVSMCPLAEVLRGMGLHVQGSDMTESDTVRHLRSLGIPVAIGHNAENLGDCDLVVRTAAVHDSNPEIAGAVARGIPVYERAQAWGAIMQRYPNALCVAGTHGKTTTTSMCTHIIMAARMDPTVMIGGTLPLLGSGYRVGHGDTIILESCEYCNSFLSFFPTVAVILNIEADHLDFFKDLDDVEHSFRAFADRVPESGIIVANADDANTMHTLEGEERPVLTFGLEQGDVRAANLAWNRGLPSFDVVYRGDVFTHVALRVPGEHNVKNALAAAAAAIALAVEPEAVSEGLAAFRGAGRRFEHKGTYHGAEVYDDYAHHPGELHALLSAARTLGYERVICAFQPHTYTRTHALFNDFVEALRAPDITLLAEIYAAREVNDIGISSKDLAARIPGSEYYATLPEVTERLRALGADVWEYPCIATVPIPPCPDVDGALERLSGYEWLALTSPAGVDAVWACLDGKGLDARALGGLKLAAIGPGTAKALAGHGLRADYVPEVYDAAHLGAGLPARGRVLILRAEEGSPALTEALKGRNIGYDDVACYRTVYENPRSDELRAAVESGAAGIVTFTSASTVKGFVASVGEDADFSRMVGACIGAQTAAEARKHGIPAAVAREATMDALVELITALRD